MTCSIERCWPFFYKMKIFKNSLANNGHFPSSLSTVSSFWYALASYSALATFSASLNFLQTCSTFLTLYQHNIPLEAKEDDYFARNPGVRWPWTKLCSNQSAQASAIIEKHKAESGGLINEGRSSIVLCLDVDYNNEFMSVSDEFWLVVGGVGRFRGVVVVEVEVELFAGSVVGLVGDVAGGEAAWDNWVTVKKKASANG